MAVKSFDAVVVVVGGFGGAIVFVDGLFRNGGCLLMGGDAVEGREVCSHLWRKDHGEIEVAMGGSGQHSYYKVTHSC